MVQKFSGIVKKQVDYWKYQVAHYGPDHPRFRPAKIAKYETLIREFSALAEYLDRLEQQNPVESEAATSALAAALVQPNLATRSLLGRIRPTRQNEPLPVHLSEPARSSGNADDLSDLPPELLKELSDSAKGESDPLIKVIEGRGGTATLDEILIDLYRKYKEIGKRPIVSNKLYRLSRRGLCWSVPGKKGTYTTIKPAGTTDADGEDDQSGNDEGPDAATSGPSNEMGAAGSPDGLPKSAPNGSTPFASNPTRRKLLSETSAPHLWSPKEGHK